MSEQSQWAVVGAGAAGIATVGQLIDHGVAPQAITWIDPAFKVGDLGAYWGNVSSNTTVHLFKEFLSACSSFNFDGSDNNYELYRRDPQATCDLRLVVEPLQEVTNKLRQKTNAVEGFAKRLRLHDRRWAIECDNGIVQANNVVLATGAEPKDLDLHGPSIVSLCDGLDRERLIHSVDKNDTVAIFGSSHSAILVVRNLVEQGVKRILNFYLEPLRYAVNMGDWILHDNTGLKGETASWAREYIDGQQPDNLERYYASDKNIEQHLPECEKVIYAVGFLPRTQPEVVGFPAISHNAHNGIIAPGLFGVGIAFPEAWHDPFGSLEYRVGLWKFMDYLKRIVPLWQTYGA